MEINIFFAAIQQAFNAAVQAAVAEATKPLLERIEKLDAAVADRHERLLVLEGALTDRVLALENNPAIGVDTTLEQRVKALEERDVNAIHDIAREVANEVAEEVLNEHTSNYDHDTYDEVYNEWGGQSPDEFVRDDDLSDRISDTVNDTLRNATFSISI